MNKRIEEVRKSAKLTQDEFAKRLGMSRSFINQVAVGKREVSDRTISDICREFNVNETWLREGEGEMYRKSTADTLRDIVQSHGLKEQDYELILWFASQDDQTRKTIINAIIRAADMLRGPDTPPQE